MLKKLSWLTAPIEYAHEIAAFISPHQLRDASIAPLRYCAFDLRRFKENLVARVERPGNRLRAMIARLRLEPS